MKLQVPLVRINGIHYEVNRLISWHRGLNAKTLMRKKPWHLILIPSYVSIMAAQEWMYISQ